MAPVLRVPASGAALVGSAMVAPGRPEKIMVVSATVATVSVTGAGATGTTAGSGAMGEE